MTLYVLTTFIFLFLLVSSILVRHYSKFIGFLFILIDLFFIVLVFIYYRPNGILFDLLYLFVMGGLTFLYGLLLSKTTYDFNGKVISIIYIFNLFSLNKKLNDGRVIGKVLPYNKYQLKYNGKYIVSNEIVSAGATLISGSIGSGKTYGMISLIKQDIMSGHSIVAAEYKGDNKVTNELEEFAKQNGYDVYKISGGKANFNYDPLQTINNVGRIEAIINMRKWSIDGADAHYRTSLQLLLQKLVGGYSHRYNAEGSTEQNNSYTMGFYNYVKSYHAAKEDWDAYTTTSKLLELLITSNLEPMFKREFNKTLSFQELKNKKFIVIVSFVSSNKELATSFTSLMFKDMLDELTVDPPKKNLSLYVDEFGTLDNPFIIKDILEKGRSAKIATTLALQDINQIIIQTNEAYLNSILGIINTFIIYSGATRVTAEKFAGVQLLEIESVLMTLRKPFNGKKPTAIYISKYPVLNKRISSEVFRFEPFIYKKNIIEKSKKKSEEGSNKEYNASDNHPVDEKRDSLEQDLQHQFLTNNDINQQDLHQNNLSNDEPDSHDYNDFI